MAEAFVLDKTAILERLGGDEEIFGIMVDMYLQDVENNCTALQAALEAGVAASLQREAHTVKGLLATVGDDGGAQDALRVEQQAKAGNLENIAGPVQALQARLREVAEVLKAQTGLGG